MFIEDSPADLPPNTQVDSNISTRLLLAACAREADRQARKIAHLDMAFGQALEARRCGDLQSTPLASLPRTLAVNLQQIDRLRQEMQGLANVLDLLAHVPSMDGDLRSDLIRTCTPLVALRDRLLGSSG